MTSIYDPETLRRMCRCGHHQDSHFKCAGACLGIGCDGLCDHYRDDQKPDTKKAGKPDHPAIWRGGQLEECRCYACARG